MEALAAPTGGVDMPCSDADRPGQLEITQMATRIRHLVTSLLPYEDCLTVFKPSHPARSTIGGHRKAEAMLDTDSLIDEAVAETRG
jgi:adenylyl- and sulfurtransferase ThiI